MFGFFWNKKDNKKEAEAKDAEFKKTALVNSYLFDFVFVEGGEYIIEDADTTQLKLKINSFYMQASTVTQEFWESVMGSNPSEDKTNKNNPVTHVSWYDCQEFIIRLNSITNKSYRLPTESEWEFASRGGIHSIGYEYAGSDFINEVAWCYENSNGKLHPVKEKKPNELGLYDMSGNVWEWCNDWYFDNRLDVSNSENTQNDQSNKLKVIRGGSWDEEAFSCLVINRNDRFPNGWHYDLGFRLVISDK